MEVIQLWFISICLGFVFLYFWIEHKFSYWSRLGVLGPPPSIRKFGNVLHFVGHNPVESEIECVIKYGKVYGNYYGVKPVLTVADPELIKRIMIRDFASFMNRRKMNVYHELVNIIQFFQDGDEWKRLRLITSKIFTPAKLRSMQTIVDGCVDKLDDFFEKLLSRNGGIMYSPKTVATGFTIDTIASVAFGIEANANNEQANQSPLVTAANALFNLSAWKAVGVLALPRWLNDILGIRNVLNDQASNVIFDLAREILKQRANSAVRRNDLVQLLKEAYADQSELDSVDYSALATGRDLEESPNEAKPNQAIKPNVHSKFSQLSNDEMISQCWMILVAGMETGSGVLAHLIFELAKAPDIQRRLVADIESALAGLAVNTDQYYDAVMGKLPYLEAVIKETLRKYSPGNRLERRVTMEDCALNGIPLEKNMLIEITVHGVHYNPEYWPDPERFDPERFMPENAYMLTSCAYLPFGMGPRDCIGMRFVSQQFKLCLAKLLPKYRFSPTPDTPTKLVYLPYKMALTAQPFSIRVEKRV